MGMDGILIYRITGNLKQMARKILCPDCEKEVSSLASKYRELFESMKGIAQNKMRCDDCGSTILYADICFACVLLPNNQHSNYESQKPSTWYRDFIEPILSDPQYG